MSTDDDGYVHRPGAARETDDGAADDGTVDDGTVDDGTVDGATTASPASDSSDGDVQGAHPDRVDRDLGGRGWVLVGVLAFSLLVAPLVVLFRPPSLPYWVALLALPMLPAILLGAVGVWATTRP